MPAERTTLFLRGMPARLVRETKAAAARQGLTLADMVSRALERSLSEDDVRADGSEHELRDSIRWYERHRRDLLRRYPGEFVAVLKRKVLDHDLDFEALAGRVFARVGVRPIFMPHVQPGEPRARVRSPRRARA
jgi:hypothetical protein